jgi:hypothetical protein
MPGTDQRLQRVPRSLDTLEHLGNLVPVVGGVDEGVDQCARHLIEQMALLGDRRRRGFRRALVRMLRRDILEAGAQGLQAGSSCSFDLRITVDRPMHVVH